MQAPGSCPRHLARWLLLPLLAACGGDEPTATPPAPRRVDLAAIADGELAAAVLTECLGPLRGHLDRISATVTLPDGRTMSVFAALPTGIRYQLDGSVVTLRGDHGRRASAATGAESPTAATVLAGDELSFPRALRTLLDVTTLGPLQRATDCRRTAPNRCELRQPDGSTWTMQLRPDTLLIDRLCGPDGEAIVHDYLRTSATWIVRRVELPTLGDCQVVIDAWGLTWADDFFGTDQPTQGDATGGTPAPVAPPPRVVKVSPPGAEAHSPTPVEGNNRAQRWVVLDDPGEWRLRHELYRTHYEELDRQNQQSAGFPLFFTEDGRACMAVPFRRRGDGPEFVPPKGWVLRDHADAKVLVVYPPEGDYEQRVAAGMQMLQQAVRQPGRAAAGPIAVQPYLHLHKSVPADDKLAAPVIRMFVPLR